MKRFLISMTALLAVVGCAQQEDLVSADLGAANAPEFEVGFESSRVFINEADGAFKLAWTKGDLLSCFLNTGGQAQYKFEGETGADYGIIKAESCPSGEAIDAFYAVYPYNEANALSNGILTVTLPAEQDYAEGTFAPNANTMVSINAAKEPYYTFSNVCGFIRLKVYGDATITSIEFKGNNEEVIAGTATVDPASENKALTITGEGKTITLNCGEGVTLGATEAEATEFWLVVPPKSFDEGFTVTLTDAEGNFMVKKLDKGFVVERNKVHDGVIAYEATPEDDGKPLFDVQFGSDGAATNVGSESSLVITPQLGDRVTTTKRGDMYVATFSGEPSNDLSDTGFYYVDYSQNESFKNKLKDGFTMEVLSYTALHSFNVWNYPFGSTTFYPYHDVPAPAGSGRWCLTVNGVENNVNNWGASGHDWLIPVSTDSYTHLLLTYNGETGGVDFFINGVSYPAKNTISELNPGSALAIGALAFTENTGVRHFFGDIAMARIYNNAFTTEEALARYEEVKPTMDTLTGLTNAEKLTTLVDVKFSNDAEGNPMATDVVSNVPLTIATEGDTTDKPNLLSVEYGVAKFIPSADLAARYFKLDYSNMETIKNAINNGFTVELIQKCNVCKHQVWKGVFGGDGFGLNDSGYQKWEVYVLPDGSTYTGIGGARTVLTDGVYFHTLFSRNREDNTYTIFTNGALDFQGVHDGHNDSTYTMIGSWYSEAHRYVGYPWNGDIAMFRIYDEPINDVRVAATLYENAKPILEKATNPLTPLVDVEFSNDESGNPKATDVASGAPITVVTEGTADDYTPFLAVNDGIATFTPAEKNSAARYFKLDYSNMETLKNAINDGYTVEVIYESAVSVKYTWKGLFGGDGFGMNDTGFNKWALYYITGIGSGYVAAGDGASLIVDNGVYCHALYTRNRANNTYTLYVNGVVDHEGTNENHVDSTYTMIGAWYYEPMAWKNICWNGDIVAFRIYDEPVSASIAADYYKKAKAQIDALNAAAAE